MSTAPCLHSDIRQSFLHALRRVSASVTVVTTDGQAGRHGATVSAFSSVSADPPALLVCLLASSRIARAVSQNTRFCINVLPADARAIAERFAGREDTQITDRFSDIHYHAADGEAPVLAGATAFICTLSQSLQVGSHLICIGQVEQLIDRQIIPLTYCDGAFNPNLLNTASNADNC